LPESEISKAKTGIKESISLPFKAIEDSTQLRKEFILPAVIRHITADAKREKASPETEKSKALETALTQIDGKFEVKQINKCRLIFW
jgi:hypothetical protein